MIFDAVSHKHIADTDPALWAFLSGLKALGLPMYRARLQRYPDKKGGTLHGDRQSYTKAYTKIADYINSKRTTNKNQIVAQHIRYVPIPELV